MPRKILDAGNAMVKKKKTKFLLAWNFIEVGETGNTQVNKFKNLIWVMRAALSKRKVAAGRRVLGGGRASRLGKLEKTAFGLTL